MMLSRVKQKLFNVLKQKKCECFLFALLVLLFSFGTFASPPTSIGESDDYILASTALLNHQSDYIEDSDIELAEKLFPEHSESLQAWKQGFSSLKDHEGNKLTWYFPLYSFFVIPFILLLQALQESASYAFPIANSFYLLLSLYFLLFRLKASLWARIASTLLIAFGPLIFYIAWPSNEVFLSSLLILSSVNILNKNYKWSMLFYSLACCLNITVSPFCLFIYYKYLKDKLPRRSFSNLLGLVFSKDFFFLISINCLILIPTILNIVRWGSFVSMGGLSSHNGVFNRFAAYVLDFNFGLLGYYPLLILALILTIIFSRKSEAIVYFGSLFTIVLGFCFMSHINCGGTGLHRYLTWSSTLLIIGICFYSQFFTFKFLKLLQTLILILSIIFITAITFWFGSFRAIRNPQVDYLYQPPLATKILEVAPQYYQPLHSTFNSRVNHIDGGYVLPIEPIIHFNRNGSASKILTKSEFSKKLEAILESPSGANIPFKDESGWYFIDLPHDTFFRKKNSPQINVIYQPCSNGKRSQFLEEGWSICEPWGVLSDGDSSVFAFKNDSGIKSVSLEGDILGTQRIIVEVNGKMFSDLTYKGHVTITIPVSSNGNNIVKLIFPQCKQANGSDLRRLAFGLIRFYFQ